MSRDPLNAVTVPTWARGTTSPVTRGPKSLPDNINALPYRPELFDRVAARIHASRETAFELIDSLVVRSFVLFVLLLNLRRGGLCRVLLGRSICFALFSTSAHSSDSS